MLVNEDLSSEMFREKLFRPVEYLPNVNYFTLYNFNDEYDEVFLIKFITRACTRDNHLSAIGEVLAQCLRNACSCSYIRLQPHKQWCFGLHHKNILRPSSAHHIPPRHPYFLPIPLILCQYLIPPIPASHPSLSSSRLW